MEGRNLKQPCLHATLPRRLVDNSTHKLIFEDSAFIQAQNWEARWFGA